MARTFFGRSRARGLLLENDDARSGSFEPLKEVPEDKWVVLGLITTKRPHLEPIDELESRIREASRFMPLEHLRSEEHTSELQSQSNLVCRLLLEKKKNK